jgi:hypothetical protein
MAMAASGKPRKNTAAVRLATLRSRKLSRSRRSEIARQAARARWDRRPSPSRKGGALHLWDLAEELTRDIPAEAWKSLPADLSDQLDHYIYGTPKR